MSLNDQTGTQMPKTAWHFPSSRPAVSGWDIYVLEGHVTRYCDLGGLALVRTCASCRNISRDNN
jgi:hypothetical protein